MKTVHYDVVRVLCSTGYHYEMEGACIAPYLKRVVRKEGRNELVYLLWRRWPLPDIICHECLWFNGLFTMGRKEPASYDAWSESSVERARMSWSICC